MAVNVNREALKHAETLIKEGNLEQESHWGSAQADASAENAFIEKHGWEAYAHWHLAYDPDENEETKGRYKFPMGDFQDVHRSALIAIKQRAGSEAYSEVEDAADRLLKQLPKEETDD